MICSCQGLGKTDILGKAKQTCLFQDTGSHSWQVIHWLLLKLCKRRSVFWVRVESMLQCYKAMCWACRLDIPSSWCWLAARCCSKPFWPGELLLLLLSCLQLGIQEKVAGDVQAELGKKKLKSPATSAPGDVISSRDVSNGADFFKSIVNSFYY